MSIDFSRPSRVWVNQPSTLQPDYDLHGRVGIAVRDVWDDSDSPFVTIYFTEGPVHSRRIHTMSLAEAH